MSSSTSTAGPASGVVIVMVCSSALGLDDEIQVAVHVGRPAGKDEGGRELFRDEGGALHPFEGFESFPDVDGHLDLLGRARQGELRRAQERLSVVGGEVGLVLLARD